MEIDKKVDLELGEQPQGASCNGSACTKMCRCTVDVSDVRG